MAERYVGIDVSKHSLEVAERVGDRVVQRYSVPSSPTGCRKLARALFRSMPDGIVFEASGGYERQLREALAKASVSASMLNPRQARAFAQYKGRLCKTDRVDAATLAELAQEGRPEPSSPADLRSEQFKDLVMRRRQLMEMLTMEQNRLYQASSHLRPSIKAHIRSLNRQLVRIQERIAQTVATDSFLRERDRLLQGVKGIGPATSIAIMALLPEAGMLASKKLAALAGVAPYAADSGTLHGKRFIRGGRGPLRQALYMAALAAARCNPQLREFYRRLLAGGKPRKVALVAVMNKLIAIVNAILRDHVPWDPARRSSSGVGSVDDSSVNLLLVPVAVDSTTPVSVAVESTLSTPGTPMAPALVT